MSDDIEPHILKRYEIVRRIGKGAYGVVPFYNFSC